jgi:hypothetical protein
MIMRLPFFRPMKQLSDNRITMWFFGASRD